MIYRPPIPAGSYQPTVDTFVAFQTQLPAILRQRTGFFVFFAETVYPLLEAQRPRLNALYHPTLGCPALDPVLLQGVVLLQFVERLPDRQAAEALGFDRRWRLALHLPEDFTGFDPSRLTVFRQRLVAGDPERLIFEKVLDLLMEKGWVARRSRQRLASTHVCGLLSEMRRLEGVRETLRLALEDLEREGWLPNFCVPFWDRYVETKLDPRDGKEALRKKMDAAGEDLRVLLAWVDTQPHRFQQRDSLRWLRRVFAENFEVVDGARRQTRAQPTGAVHNPHEPEAQWSSKSTTRDKNWVGYKVQVAETVAEPSRQKAEPTKSFLTAIVTQEAPASDKPGMTHVLEEQAQMGLAAPSELYVDGA